MFSLKIRASSVRARQLVLFCWFIVVARIDALAESAVWVNEVDIDGPGNKVKVEFGCKAYADAGTVTYTLYDDKGVMLVGGTLDNCKDEIFSGFASQTITYVAASAPAGLSVCVESSVAGVLQFLSFGLLITPPLPADVTSPPDSTPAPGAQYCIGYEAEPITLLDLSNVPGDTIRLVGEGDGATYFEWINSFDGRGNIGNFPNINQSIIDTSRAPSSPPTGAPTAITSSAPSSVPSPQPTPPPTIIVTAVPSAQPTMMPSSEDCGECIARFCPSI